MFWVEGWLPTKEEHTLAKPKVAVAMSGGVDSSVACALLLEKGFEVFGITMKISEAPNDSYDSRIDQSGLGGGYFAIEDAKKVCDQLSVPHYVVDLTREFEREVIEPFVEGYTQGVTPNPCVVCNPKIKFGHLLDKAEELGADYLATGHYARCGRLRKDTQELVENCVSAAVQWAHDEDSGKWEDPCLSPRTYLVRAKDRDRDQTYVLYGLDQNMLSHAMFPLGNLTKTQVREIAREKGLHAADRLESQEICFITQESYREFLEERNVRFEPGLIVDTAGEVLGCHRGLQNYTVGQRRGLGIHGPDPLYVIRIDVEENKLIVGKREEGYAHGCYIHRLNFIMTEAPDSPVHGTCAVRYRGKEVEATLYPPAFLMAKGEEGGASKDLRDIAYVKFSTPLFAVAPGQSLVFYQGDFVYGGGTILKSINESQNGKEGI